MTTDTTHADSDSGDQHDHDDKTDCRLTLRDLERFLDGELSAEQRTHVLEHLDDCLECYHAYDFQAELRQVVAAKCSNDELPAELQERLRRACHGDGSPLE